MAQRTTGSNSFGVKVKICLLSAERSLFPFFFSLYLFSRLSFSAPPKLSVSIIRKVTEMWQEGKLRLADAGLPLGDPQAKQEWGKTERIMLCNPQKCRDVQTSPSPRAICPRACPRSGLRAPRRPAAGWSPQRARLAKPKVLTVWPFTEKVLLESLRPGVTSCRHFAPWFSRSR